MSVRIRAIASSDETAIRTLLGRIAIFEPHEIRVAEELVAESLAGSPDYVIHVAEDSDLPADGGAAARVMGYVCYGHNPVTDSLHDLYWIAVDPAVQGRGVGRALLAHAEQSIRIAGGRGIVIDTSSRPEYEPARTLYDRAGYRRVADIPDYYKPGDALLIYMKLL
jgi:ribosomal protein S18 acetylase RimI-like enzyme